MGTIIKAIGACLLAAPLFAQASLLTSAPVGGTTTVLSTITGTWTSAPSVLAGGYTVFAPPGEEVWYGDSNFGLTSNGNWNDFAYVGGYCFSGSCTATFDLGGLASAVGGFMNYAPGYGTPLISALAADGVTVLESYDLAALAPIVTPGGLNDGEFRGIFRSEADIAYFQISGSYLIMHDLTVSAVPEPETYAMLLAGLGILGFAARRRKQVS